MKMERLKELSKFSQAFDFNQMNTVHQWVKRFGWNREDEDRLKTLVDQHHELRRLESEAMFRKHKPKPGAKKLKGKEIKKELKKVLPTKIDLEIRQNEAKMPVVGFCPRCGSVLGGQPCGGCKKLHYDRVFMKVCGTCSYYSEIFRRGNKHYEVEGG
jgi:hypothetical protein